MTRKNTEPIYRRAGVLRCSCLYLHWRFGYPTHSELVSMHAGSLTSPAFILPPAPFRSSYITFLFPQEYICTL